MKKVAKLVSRATVSPVHVHDCDGCRFLGRLNGSDLYFCPANGEYISRYGSEGPQYSSLGSFTPEGSPVSLARELHKRGLPPREYRAEADLLDAPRRGVRVVAAGDGSLFRA